MMGVSNTAQAEAKTKLILLRNQSEPCDYGGLLSTNQPEAI